MTSKTNTGEVLCDCIARYSGIRVSVHDARVIMQWMGEAGLVVVPREPTSDMLDAGMRERQDGGGLTEVWAAMIEAARAR
jgi:hypothetical protein